MKIGIYNESSGGSLGGSEYMTALLAQALSRTAEVDLVHHLPGVTRQELESFGGFDLRKVGLRYVEPERFEPPAGDGLVRDWKRARRWHAALSEPYELFVGAVHSAPPFCQAPRGLLIVLFPHVNHLAAWPFNDPPLHPFDIKRRLRNAYYRREWAERLGSYTQIASISDFTRVWTRKHWGADSTVIYPPVSSRPFDGTKSPEILSVGRFTPLWHTKKYPELIRAIADVQEVADSGWTYHCAGTLSSRQEDQQYFEMLRSLADPRGVRLHQNLTRDELLCRYEQASLFVHATGLDEPDDRPQATEHFGISTVEAMAAGCVPIVIDKGGQPEIVQHGESGFVWRTILDLQQYIALLVGDQALRGRMSAAARARAQAFSAPSFVRAAGALLHIPVELPSEA